MTLGRAWDIYRSDHAHEAALINTKPKGGTYAKESASGFYPGGHNPLADSVRGDNNWGGQNPL